MPSKVDSRAFQEDTGLHNLLAHGEFERASRVVEFGCGAGRFAEQLLSAHLPADATYVGCDVSTTMCHLARARLERFDSRAKVLPTDGSIRLPFEDGQFDCFLTTYVLDLLEEDEVADLLKEARRLLVSGGLLCAVNTAGSREIPSNRVTGLWKRIRALRRLLPGGCRPIDLAGRLDRKTWDIRHRAVVVTFGIPSQVVVARARPPRRVSS